MSDDYKFGGGPKSVGFVLTTHPHITVDIDNPHNTFAAMYLAECHERLGSEGAAGIVIDDLLGRIDYLESDLMENDEYDQSI